MKSHYSHKTFVLLQVPLVVMSMLTPLFAFAAPSTFRGLVDLVINLVNSAFVPFVFALAFIVFIWGVAQYFIFSTEEAKTKGRDFIVWGLVGMFVMISVWGLVNIVVNTFFLERGCISNPGAFGCIGP